MPLDICVILFILVQKIWGQEMAFLSQAGKTFRLIALASVVKAEMRRGCGSRSRRYFVARTLIYLILKDHIVQKEILKYLKHYLKFMKYS